MIQFDMPTNSDLQSLTFFAISIPNGFHQSFNPEETVRKLWREGLATIVLKACQDPADLFILSARVIVGAKKRKSKKKE